jgi:hypothetical protein
MLAMVAPRRVALALVALGAAGCAGSSASTRHRPLPPPAGEGRAVARSPRTDGPASASDRALPPDVRRALDVARSLVGQRQIVVDGRDWGSGCAALVLAALDAAGRPPPAVARDASSLHAVAASRGTLRTGLRPAPGDVVFLSDRPGGAPLHVGLVASVDPDGTAVVLHRLARGVSRMRVNLGYPGSIADPSTGRRLNDTLAVGMSAVPAGSLVVGVASFL